METSHEKCVFTLGCTLTAIHIAVLIHRSKVVNDWVKGAREFIQRSSGHVKRKSDDPLAPYVAEMMRTRVLEQARNIYKLGALFCSMVMIGILVTLMTNKTRWCSPKLDYIILVVYPSVMICAYVSSSLRHTTVAVWYSGFMLIMIASILAVSRDNLPVLCNALIVLRFMLGLTCLNMNLIAVWNFAFWLIASFWYAWNVADCPKIASSSVFIAGGFWSAVVLTMCLEGIKTNMATGFRRDIEAKASSNEHRAVKSILLTLCDAVVELDSEFKIVERAQELACILLHGDGRALLGEPFTNFMASDCDREHFFNFVSNDRENGTSRATAFHAHMHDCHSNNIHVEIFHVSFYHDPHDSLHHLIGVREFTDGPPGHDLGDAPELREASPQDFLVPCFSTNSSSYIVRFDAFTFSVIDCSTGFMGLCGSSPIGKSFKDWLMDDIKEHFLEQYAETVNEFINSDSVSDGLIFESLPLVIPVSVVAQVQLHDACHIQFCLPETCGVQASDAEVIATAKMPNLRPQTLSKHQTNSS